MNRIGTPPMPVDDILAATLMGYAIDFAVAFEKKDDKLMASIYRGVLQLAVVAPDFVAKVKQRQHVARAQMGQDLEAAETGAPLITPGIREKKT